MRILVVGGFRATAAVAAIFLMSCAVDGTGYDESGCPPPELAARYDLVGSPRLCGGCDVDCHLTTDSPTDVDLGDMNGDGIQDSPRDSRVWAESTAYLPAPIDGIKIVPPGVRITSNYAWVANTEISTVTKVHLQNYTADGVYKVGLQAVQAIGRGNFPSRTTVDILGCAYVANRAIDGGRGSVTKLAGELADCPDLNANDVVDTSTGLDDIRGWPLAGDQDECALWTVPVGGDGHIPRALAIDALGRIWVGLWATREFIVIDSVSGEEVGSVAIALRPYGAAVAPDGRLWTTTYDGSGRGIQAINTLTTSPNDADAEALIPDAPVGAYSIAVDKDNRVYLANRTNGGAGGFARYDPSTLTWETVVNANSSESWGVVADEFGAVFTGDLRTHMVTEYDGTAMTITTDYDLAPGGGKNPKGVCPDFWGQIWAANQGVMPASGGRGSVSVIDPLIGVTHTIPTQAWNYTYSDFTGYGLMTFAALVGYVFRDYQSIDACAGRSTRERIYYTATFDDPGVINFHGRSSDNLADLPTADETWLGTADGSSAPGTISGSVPVRGPMNDFEASRYYFRLRIELLRAGLASPVIHEWTLEEYCL